jgi:hypothetical protein
LDILKWSLNGDFLALGAWPLNLKEAGPDQAGLDLLFFHRRVNADTKDVGRFCLRVLGKLAQATEVEPKRSEPESKVFPGFFCHGLAFLMR